MSEELSGTGSNESRGPSDPNAAASGWVVLVVDDEPEVHEVTHMMLSRTRFCGAPVELHSAYSAVEAKKFLKEKGHTALILLDVVMETDDAGLQLCRYVREDLQNKDVQIVLRTGQPGQAPEREVILNYDINGYFLKTEITSQKLYSILISSLRSYNYIKTLREYHQGLSRSEKVSTDSRGYRPGIVNELRSAIENNELNLVAQPQIHLKNGAVVGVEIFLRWRDIPPAEIIAIANRADVITPLTEWVLNQACDLTKTWQDAGIKPLRTAVNVSLVQFIRGDLAASVERALAKSGLPPACLELEMAETDLMESLRSGGITLRRLQEMGVGIAVDSFGMGLASLSRLQQLRPNQLKIDRSFVQAVRSDPDSAAITRAIIALAHTLGMSVVAEGVETREQLEFLSWEECEVAQGNYFSAPMPIEHIPELLRPPNANIQ